MGALVERHFSSSIVTATSAFAESLTWLPSTPATRLLKPYELQQLLDAVLR
jgi:hypothetical protein